jgi:ABC-type glycerol-3-phosphate transport system permease component
MASPSALQEAPAAERGRRQAAGLPKDFSWKLFTYAVLVIGAVISLVPFAWMVLASLMTLGESMGATFVPAELHFENYLEAWQEAQFSHYLINSVVITVITLAGELVFSVMAAYAFARMKFPGREVLFGILLSSMMIPGVVTMIPNLLTVTWLGRIGPIAWIDNWPSLTIPFMGSVFSVFLLRQFFAQIPEELFEAAKIDGAGHWRMLTQIALPLSTAPILVITVLSFIGSWNALAWPLLVTNSPKWLPIAVGLYEFVSDQGSKVNLIMAGSVITIVPILILYFFTQRQFTESIARSGLKG